MLRCGRANVNDTFAHANAQTSRTNGFCQVSIWVAERHKMKRARRNDYTGRKWFLKNAQECDQVRFLLRRENKAKAALVKLHGIQQSLSGSVMEIRGAG